MWENQRLNLKDGHVRTRLEVAEKGRDAWRDKEFLRSLRQMKKVLFNTPKDMVLEVYGEQWMRETLELLNEMNRKVVENGWKYHIPQPYQEVFHQSRRRVRLVLGGNRSGKTISGIWEACTFALGYNPYKPDLFIPQPCSVVVTSKTTKTMKMYVNDYLFRFLPRKQVKRVERLKGDILDYVELMNGSKITLMSYDQGRERFQGFSANAIHFDEEPPEDIYHECAMRLIDTQGYMWLTMTPLLGLTWVYHELYLNPHDDPEIETYEWNIYDNVCLDKQTVSRVLEKLPNEIREARAKGAFIGLSGIVYPWFTRDSAYSEPFSIPDDWQRFRSIDPSASGITAVLWGAVDPENNIWFYREYYGRDRTVSEHCEYIRAMSGSEKYELDLIDSAAMEQNREVGKTTYQLYQENLYRDGFSKNPLLLARKEIIPGIETVWEYCRGAEDYVQGKLPCHPYVRIFNTCTNFRFEARKYRWQEKLSGPEKGERVPKPIHKQCHLMDCLRYACHYGISHKKLVRSPEIEAKRRMRNVKDSVTGY